MSAFNGGTAIGTWLGASALESTLGVVGPLTVAVILAVLGLLALLAMAVMRMTSNVQASQPNFTLEQPSGHVVAKPLRKP